MANCGKCFLAEISFVHLVKLKSKSTWSATVQYNESMQLWHNTGLNRHNCTYTGFWHSFNKSTVTNTLSLLIDIWWECFGRLSDDNVNHTTVMLFSDSRNFLFSDSRNFQSLSGTARSSSPRSSSPAPTISAPHHSIKVDIYSLCFTSAHDTQAINTSWVTTTAIISPKMLSLLVLVS